MGDIQANSFSRNASTTAVAERDRYANRLGLSASLSSVGIIDAFAELFSEMGSLVPPETPESPNNKDSLAERDKDASEKSSLDDEEDDTGSKPKPPEQASLLSVAVKDPATQTQEIQTTESSDGDNVGDDANLKVDPAPADNSEEADHGTPAKSRAEQTIGPGTGRDIGLNRGPNNGQNNGPNSGKVGETQAQVEPLPASKVEVTQSQQETASLEAQQKTLPAEHASTKDATSESNPQPIKGERDAVEQGALPADEPNREERRSRRHDRGDMRDLKTGSNQSFADKNAIARERSAEQKAIKVAEAAAMTEASLQSEPSTSSVPPTKVGIVNPAVVSSAVVAATASTGNGLRASTTASGSGTSSSGATSTPNVSIGTSATATDSSSSSSKSMNPSPQASTTDLISRAKLIQRVSKAFQHLGTAGGHVRLRLAPAELGTVRLEMQISNRKMQGRVIAENEAAASALREHLPELRMRLESQGIQIEKMSVEVEPEPQSGDRSGAEHSAGDQGHDSNRSRNSWRKSKSPERIVKADDRRGSGLHPGLAPNQYPLSGVDVQL